MGSRLPFFAATLLLWGSPVLAQSVSPDTVQPAPDQPTTTQPAPEQAPAAAPQEKPKPKVRLPPVTVVPWEWPKELAMTPISLQKAQSLYQRFVSKPLYHAGFVDDGCYARAYLMSIEMERMGIISTKALAVANKDGGTFSFTYNPSHESFNWNYHIVPVVLVDTGKSEDGKKQYVTYVFDLVLFTEPVPFKKWWDTLQSYSTRSAGYQILPRFAYQPDSQIDQAWNPALIAKSKAVLKQYSGAEGAASVVIDNSLKLVVSGPSKASCKTEKTGAYVVYHCDITVQNKVPKGGS